MVNLMCWWNDGHPVVRIGQRFVWMGAGHRMSVLQSWCEQHKIAFFPGRPWTRARVANRGLSDGSGKGLPDGVGHDARDVVCKVSPRTAPAILKAQCASSHVSTSA